MAKLFIGIALVLMLATAALGFLAKGQVDKLQSSLKDTKGSLTRTQGDLQTTKNDLKKSNEERDASNMKAEEAQKNLETTKTDLNKATSDLQAATAAGTAKDTEIADLKDKLSKIPSPTNPANPVEDPRIAQLQTEVQTAKAAEAEAKMLYQKKVDESKDNEVKLADLQKKESDREKGLTRKGLTGRILAVNPGWNFAVINVGDRQGVTVNSPLLVVRGGVPVARLRITSVEPSTSIADVVPGSVARGVTVQPGDSVIFEGTRFLVEELKNQSSQSPPDTTTTTPPPPGNR